MADAFNINWVDRMKTDPRANSILNDKTEFQTFYTWDIQPIRGFHPRLRRLQRFDRRMNQLYSDRYVKDYRDLNVNGPGRYRYDRMAYRANRYIADNPEKYWENNIGNPLYKKDSIANTPNPHIEKLAYKE